MKKTWTTPKGTVLPLLDLKGKEYLQVAHRIVWAREEKPEYQFSTEFLELNNDFAIAKATIRNEAGVIMATAHKREDRGHFADYMEKAEAGALGRALAYIGYGTQFCADELDEGQRIADAPTTAMKKTQAKPAVAIPAPTSDSPADYVVKVGFLKGKRLADCPAEELRNTIKFFESSRSRDAIELVQKATEFFNTTKEATAS
jgi:hypothetical protein